MPFSTNQRMATAERSPPTKETVTGFPVTPEFDHGLLDRLGDLHRIGDGGFAVQHYNAFGPGVGIGVTDRVAVPFIASHTGQVNRVLGGAKFRHVFLEFEPEHPQGRISTADRTFQPHR